MFPLCTFVKLPLFKLVCVLYCILPIGNVSVHDGIVGHDGIMVHDDIVGLGGA